MINVAIVDDHSVVRDGIELFLNNEADIQVISKASDGNEFLTNIRNEMPDIAILDMVLPNESGLALLKKVKLEFSELPVLVLSSRSPEHYAIRSLRAGASGYINKMDSSEEVAKAIRYVINKKKKYINQDVAELLANNITAEIEEAPHENLSNREFTVLCMIARGDNIKSIAGNLSLSPNTIQTYRTRIKKKMHLNSDVAITRYAIEHDLI